MSNTYNWQGGSASFNTVSKWTLSTNSKIHAVPGSSDNANFAKAGVISGNGSVSQITIEAKVTFSGDITASYAEAGIVVTGGMTVDSTGRIVATDIVTGNAAVVFDAKSTVHVGGGANHIAAGAVGLNFGGGNIKFVGDTIDSTGLIAIGNSANGVTNSGSSVAKASGGAKITASYTGLAGTGGIASTDSNHGMLTITGAGTTWSNTGKAGGQGGQGSILVGVTGDAKLYVEAGASLLDNTYGDIAVGSASVSLAEVEGAGSKWANVAAVYVGDGGHGQLIVSGGGAVSSGGGTIGDQAGSVGAVTIGAKSTWSNTLWFDVGYEGSGTLKIAAGGSMTVGKDLNLANGAAVEAGSVHGGKGQVVVDGAGANFDVNGQIDLGVDGSGALAVEADGKVVSGDASGKTASGVVLGFYSDGVGSLNVTGAGSSLVNTGFFEVAAGGDGTMTVAAGAKVTTNVKQTLGFDGLYIGGGSGSVGRIAVSGKGSKFDVGSDAIIGEGGTGALNVSSAGAVLIGASLASASDVAVDLGLDKGSKGSVAVAGSTSTFEVDGQVDLGVSGAGVFDVENEGLFRATGNTTIGEDQGSQGSLVVSGSVTNAGKLTRSEFAYGGQLDIGDSGAGLLSVEAGALVTFLSGGSLAGDINVGAAADGGGKVTISGAGSLLRGVRLILGGATGATASVTISNGGALTVTGDASIDAGATVTLAGGDLNAVEANFAKTGALKGFGLVGAGTIDGGALTASGGVLQLKGLVEDATLRVSNNSTMQLDGGAAKTTILDFTGTVGEQFSFLKPQSIGATIDNFLKGDTLDLGNVTVKTDTVQLVGASETTLTLSLSDGDVAKLTFAGAYTKSDFVFTAQSGSTIISHI